MEQNPDVECHVFLTFIYKRPSKKRRGPEFNATEGILAFVFPDVQNEKLKQRSTKDLGKLSYIKHTKLKGYFNKPNH